MKNPTSMIRNLVLVAAFSMSPQMASAQLIWGPGGTGGAGTWNNTNTNWYDGVDDVVWDSGTANFSVPAGAVTVSGTQSATGLVFGTNFYTLGGGEISLTGATPTISGAAGITINTTLSSSTGVTFENGKTIGGNNANLNGVITVNGNGSGSSTLRVASSNALGSSAAFADRVNLVQGTNGATLQLDNGVSLNKYITNTGAANIETTGGSSELTGNFVPGGTVVFNVASNTQLTLSGSAGLGQSGQSLQTVGAGRLIVNATASATAYGLFIRNSSTVQVNSGVTLGSANVFFDGGAGTPTLTLNGGTVSNNIFFGATASPRIENMASGTSTFSGQLLSNGGNFNTLLRSTTSGTLNVSGNISDGGNSASVAIGSAASVNSGVVNLSRATGNAYDGGTTVHSGTLLVNNASGSATGTGGVTVEIGATLGGAGMISGATVIDGIVAPGNSIGTLTVQNDVTWNGGTLADAATDWKFELGAANAADLLNITGVDSDFLKGSGSVFRFDFQGATELGTFVLIDWTGMTNFSVNDFSYTNLGGGNIGTFAFNGSQLELITAVPEPSSVMLLAMSLSVMLLVVRRRIRNNQSRIHEI